MYLRSMLFAPGTNEKVMRKAILSDADSVIIDLEDSVPMHLKEEIRSQVCQFLQTAELPKKNIFVRINSWDGTWGKRDLIAMTALPISGIMLPKAEEAEQLRQVAALLPEDMELIPLVETAKGVLHAEELATAEKVSRLAFGAIDYTLDIGTTLSKTGHELLFARSYLVLASTAAGILPPIDTVYPDIHDTAGYAVELEEIKCLGMGGKLLIHPSQIAAAHEAFTPSAEEMAHAQKVISAFEEAERQGKAAVQVDGKMVDYPVYAQALKKMEMAK